ncbi:CvpA family protein [Candidatus Uhrbacteria bacterium]|nr:CvpA family protein [Candidatus Uhrbacteria bacterium]
MTLLDVILIVIMLLFVAAGFRSGAIHSVATVIGFAVGIWVANHYYGVVAERFAPMIGGQLLLAKLIAYPVIVVVVSKAVGITAWLVGKILGLIPLFGTFNMVIGAFIGAFESWLVLGLVLTLFIRYPSITVVDKEIARSSVAQNIINSYGRMLQYLPKEFQSLDALDIASWKKVQAAAGDRWKEFQNAKGAEGFQKIQELRHMLPEQY